MLLPSGITRQFKDHPFAFSMKVARFWLYKQFWTSSQVGRFADLPKVQGSLKQEYRFFQGDVMFSKKVSITSGA